MLESILDYPDLGLLALRVVVGIVFIYHGWPKLNPSSPIGGAAGFAGGLKQIGVPAPTFFAWVVALLETAGAVLLIVGVAARLVALGLVIDMLVVIWARRSKWGATFMSQQGASGWEFEFTLLGAALALLLAGPGSIALDLGLGL